MGKIKTTYYDNLFELENDEPYYAPDPKPEPGDILVQENNPNILNIKEDLYMRPSGELYGIMKSNSQTWRIEYGKESKNNYN